VIKLGVAGLRLQVLSPRMVLKNALHSHDTAVGLLLGRLGRWISTNPTPARQAIFPAKMDARSPMVRNMAGQCSGHERTISQVPNTTTRHDSGRPRRQ